MKKYIVTLAAMALAIGGTIHLTGCGGPADDPDAAKADAPSGDGPEIGGTAKEDDEDAKAAGYEGDPGTGTDPAPEKKDSEKKD